MKELKEKIEILDNDRKDQWVIIKELIALLKELSSRVEKLEEKINNVGGKKK